MALVTITRYAVRCDAPGCRRTGPEASSRLVAARRAVAAGFAVHGAGYRCPRCLGLLCAAGCVAGPAFDVLAPRPEAG